MMNNTMFKEISLVVPNIVNDKHCISKSLSSLLAKDGTLYGNMITKVTQSKVFTATEFNKTFSG
jgi:hypothetical protein